MERIECGLSGPRLADEFVGREALEGLEPARKVVSRDEVGEMPAELVVALVVEALDGGVLDGPVHSLDLAVGPRMPGLGGAVLNVVGGAIIFEGMSPEAFAVGDCLLINGTADPPAPGVVNWIP